MPILIIEPDWTLRQHAFNIAAKLTGAENVFEAFDGNHALELARRKRPSLILCEPSLPDTCGAQLCEWLRPQLSQTLFVGFCNNELKNPTFDRTIKKPLKRPDLIDLLQQRKRIRTKPAARPTIRIFVSPAETSWLKFGIFMPENSTVAMALKQTGKERILWYVLLRNGSEIVAETDCVLQEGDTLIIRA